MNGIVISLIAVIVVVFLTMISHRFFAKLAAGAVTTHPRPTDPGIFYPDPMITNESTRISEIKTWLQSRIQYYTDIIAWKDKTNLDTPRVSEWMYWLGCLLVVGVSLLVILLIELYAPPVLFAGTSFPIDPSIFVYIFIAIYFVAGFRTVGTDQVAGADFFGEPVFQFDSGLKWVPWLIFGFNKEPTTFMQAEFPGDADRIQWTDEKVALLPGKIRPLYLITGERPQTDFKTGLPTDIQMNIGVALFVQFQLVKSRFFDLEANIGNIDPAQKDSIKQSITGGAEITDKMLEAVRQMRDTSTTFLIEVLGQLSLNEIRREMSLINKLMKLMLKAKVMSWGLELPDAGITKTNGGHEFSEKMQERATAMAARDNLIIVAQGEMERLIKEGEGNASAIQAALTAKAAGYAAIAAQTATDAGAAAMNAEVVAKLAEAGNVVVVGTQGIADLFGLASAVKKKGGTP